MRNNFALFKLNNFLINNNYEMLLDMYGIFHVTYRTTKKNFFSHLLLFTKIDLLINVIVKLTNLQICK